MKNTKKSDYYTQSFKRKKSGRSFYGGGFGQNRRKPRNNQARRMPMFDPSMVVKKAVERTKSEVQIKHEFVDFGLHEQLVKNIASRGYTKPTPIQDQIIPFILQGRDIVGSASTGTGKTAAFLLPLLNNILAGTTQKVLILAPTRELAEQIQTELTAFKKGLPIYSALCIGGEDIVKQYRQLDRDPQFIVATPGRLMDLYNRNKIDFQEFTTIVLDEFDMMLDMGFLGEVKEVMAKLPTDKHCVFFSATMPPKMTKLVDSFLNNPVKITVSTQTSSENVTQEIIKINGRNKLDVLYDLLKQDSFEKVLVFSRTKRETHRLSQSLTQLNIPVVAIHGNKTQDQRKRALKQFRSNRVNIMLATDVVSRGLDIDNVTHVINYDLPQTYEDYIHRIGRTGRADKTGIALTFVD